MKEPRNRNVTPIQGSAPHDDRRNQHEPPRAVVLEVLEKIAREDGWLSLAHLRSAVLRTRKVRA